MSRTKSSSIARLKDIITQLSIIANDLSDEHDALVIASDRLKEIEPALNKLTNALKPTPDFCPTDGIQEVPIPPSEPKKRSRRTKPENTGETINEVE